MSAKHIVILLRALHHNLPTFLEVALRQIILYAIKNKMIEKSVLSKRNVNIGLEHVLYGITVWE